MSGREFESSLSTPGHARQYALDVLAEFFAGGAPGSLCDDVELVVSELVTNAVRAGSAHVRLEVVLVGPSRVVVSVTDAAEGWPQPREAATDDLGGRGLALVGAIASTWGARLEDGTKTVWAELAVAD